MLLTSGSTLIFHGPISIRLQGAGRERTGLSHGCASLGAGGDGLGDNSQLWCQKHLPGASGCARKGEGGWGIRMTHSTAAPGYFPFLTRININKGGQELLQRIKRQNQSISHGIKLEHLIFFPSYYWNLVSTARGNIAQMKKEINPKYLPGNCFKAQKPLLLSFVKRTKNQSHTPFWS